MTDRRKTSDVLWLAFQYAKQDRQAFIDAWSNDTSEPCVKDALKDIAAFERLQTKLFGTTKSKLDAAMDKMKSVNILELRKLLTAESRLPTQRAADGKNRRR